MNDKRYFSVHVGNLPSTTIEDDVRKTFRDIGGLRDVTLRSCADQSHKFAFVTFEGKHQAAKAIREKNGRVIRGANIKVSEKKHQDYSGSKANSGGGLLDYRLTGGEKAVKLIVTYVHDACTFVAQEEEKINLVEMVMDAVFQQSRKGNTIRGPPNMNKIYAARCNEDGRWYRCKVLHSPGPNSTTVNFVDYGGTDVVQNNQMILLPRELQDVPDLGVCYRLDGVKPDENASEYDLQAGKKWLFSAVDRRTMDAVIWKDHVADVWIANCYSNGVSLSDELIFRGYAVPTRKPNFHPEMSRMPVDDRYQRYGLTQELDVLSNENRHLQQIIVDMKAQISRSMNAQPRYKAVERDSRRTRPTFAPKAARTGVMRVGVGSKSTRAPIKNPAKKSPAKIIKKNETKDSTKNEKIEGSENQVNGDSSPKNQLSGNEKTKGEKGTERLVGNKAEAKRVRPPRFQMLMTEIYELLQESEKIVCRAGIDEADKDSLLEKALVAVQTGTFDMPDQLKESHKVLKKKVAELEDTQNKIRSCTSQEQLTKEMIKGRDNLRKEIYSSVEECERLAEEWDVQEKFSGAQEIHSELKKGKLEHKKWMDALNLQEIVKEYEEFKKSEKNKYCLRHMDSITLRDSVSKHMKEMGEVLGADLSDENKEKLCSIPDIMVDVYKLKDALKSQVKATDEKKCDAAVIQKLHTCLQATMNLTVADIQKFEANLAKYKAAAEKMKEGTEEKPDIEEYLTVQKETKLLMSKLRRRRVDLLEMDENHASESERDGVKNEIKTLIEEIKVKELLEQQALDQVRKAAEYFPEIAAGRPELDLKAPRKTGHPTQNGIDNLPDTKSKSESGKSSVVYSSWASEEFSPEN